MQMRLQVCMYALGVHVCMGTCVDHVCAQIQRVKVYECSSTYVYVSNVCVSACVYMGQCVQVHVCLQLPVYIWVYPCIVCMCMQVNCVCKYMCM